MVEGNFDIELPKVLEQNPKLDFVFIDGNHRKEPTINYFEQVLANIHNNTIVVLDDIHWSNEMEAAWNEIIQDKNVKVTIDLFYFGIVFFKENNANMKFLGILVIFMKFHGSYHFY